MTGVQTCAVPISPHLETDPAGRQPERTFQGPAGGNPHKSGLFLGVRLLNPLRAGADLPLLPPPEMTSAPFAVMLAAAGILAAGAGMADPGPFSPQAPDRPVRQRSVPANATPRPAVPDELAVPADAVLGLQLETLVTTPDVGEEEPVVARVIRDVMVGGRAAVPTGARVLGTATLVEKTPSGKEGPRLEVHFDTIELPGGERVEIDTEPVTRHVGGRAPSLGRLGSGAAGGALVGAILGGGRGAAIGGALGAAGAAVTAPGRDRVELPAGTVLSVRTREEFRVRVRR